MPNERRSIKVFLCHSHSDRIAARDVYVRLTRDGVDAWLDKEKLLPGQDWEYEIRRAVRESDVVVVCLSKQFNEAGFRQKEVRLALDTAMEKPQGEIFIIPARLEECDIPESLRRLHWVDLFEEGGYDQLLRALHKQFNNKDIPLPRSKPGDTQPGQTETPKRKIPKPRPGWRWLPWLVMVGMAIFLLGTYRLFSGVFAPPEPTPMPSNTSALIQPVTSGTTCPDEPADVTLEFARVVTAAICPQGDTDIFRFSATSGEKVRIQVTYLKGTMRPCIELLAPDATSTKVCENAFENVIDATLDQTGTYTIVVDVFFLGEGDYTLVVQRL